jgi:hypothetical protein
MATPLVLLVYTQGSIAFRCSQGIDPENPAPLLKTAADVVDESRGLPVAKRV